MASLDFTNLNAAVAKVASLAASHADLSGAVAAANAARDAAVSDLAQAQKDIDALAAQLLASATTPAEAAGIAAVASVLVAPAPVADVPSAPAVDPVAPVAPVAQPPLGAVISPAVAAITSPATTFLPGDPRATVVPNA